MNRQKDYPLTASSWYNMRQRVNKNYDGYYGSVEMDPRWKSFDNFVNDMGKRPGKEYDLDRIDNAGNYEPGNCRWVTHEDNMANRKCSILYNGKTLGQWARILNQPYDKIRYRIRVQNRKIEEVINEFYMS